MAGGGDGHVVVDGKGIGIVHDRFATEALPAIKSIATRHTHCQFDAGACLVSVLLGLHTDSARRWLLDGESIILLLLTEAHTRGCRRTNINVIKREVGFYGSIDLKAQ